MDGFKIEIHFSYLKEGIFCGWKIKRFVGIVMDTLWEDIYLADFERSMSLQRGVLSNRQNQQQAYNMVYICEYYKVYVL